MAGNMSIYIDIRLWKGDRRSIQPGSGV